MIRDEIRQLLLDAIERGEIPPHGPSELAALGLLEDVPEGYFERWAQDSSERIREQTAQARCTCAIPADIERGRCSRCGRRPREGA
jgi:hypothetical protein